MPKCKSKTKFLPATFAWILLLGTTSIFFAFPCLNWYINHQQWYAVPIFQGILTIFVLINFSMATFMDPGVIPRASPDEDRDDDLRAPLYRNVEINGITVRMKWCVTCQFYRPPRCSHCSVCNNCIEIFDHHCPWVNNCIGRRNYRYFFMFLISLSLHMKSIFIFSLIHALHNKNNLTEPAVIISIVIMCIISLLFIPIFGLTGFHIVLVARGRTTNEQVTGKFRGGYNPFSKNCCYNCCYTLCGPQYPSLKHPAKYIGRKPRKYQVPVPVTKQDGSGGQQVASPSNSSGPPGSQTPGPPSNGGIMSSGGSMRSSRLPPRGQGVEPIAAQAAAVARTYRDNGLKHSNSSYNRMSATSNDMDQGSDMDEPMASQSKDIEPTLSHNNSKSNFFNEEEDMINRSRNDDGNMSRSTVNTTLHSQSYNSPQSASPYQNHAGRMLHQPGYPAASHLLQKPVKRSGTPDYMLSESGVELRTLPPSSSSAGQPPRYTSHHHSAPSPTITMASKVRNIVGIPTPLAGQTGIPSASVASSGGGPSVSSPGRYSGLTTPLYSANHHTLVSGGNTTIYNPGYQQPSRRYLSEGELLEPQQQHQVMTTSSGMGPSTSAGHIQELAGSPNPSYYMWKAEPGGGQPTIQYTAAGQSISYGGGGYGQQEHHHHHPLHAHHTHLTTSPAHTTQTSSYAQQVNYYLQQQLPPGVPPPSSSTGSPGSDFVAPSLQSGGPRTTPSGYPGGPMVPGGQAGGRSTASQQSHQRR